MGKKKYVIEGSGLMRASNIQTTCSRMNCPHRKECRVNIYADGLVCPSYKSQRQWIYSQYLKDCEKRGEKPMSIPIYFEDAFR